MKKKDVMNMYLCTSYEIVLVCYLAFAICFVYVDEDMDVMHFRGKKIYAFFFI